MFFFNKKLNFFFIPILFWGSGCSLLQDSRSQKESMMRSYQNGNFEKALQVSEKKANSTLSLKDHVMWALESGSLAFYSGDYQKCLLYMDKAEAMITAFDERATLSFRDTTSTILMLITNLNALPYQGFVRDRMMIPIFRSFCYLGLKDEEAFKVEVRKIREIQREIIEKYNDLFEKEEKAFEKVKEKYANDSLKSSFFDIDSLCNNNKTLNDLFNKSNEIAHKGYGNLMNPLGIFLSGIVYLREEDYENALVDFERLYKVMPNSKIIQQLYVSILLLAKREIPEELTDVKNLNFDVQKKSVYIFYSNGITASFRSIGINFPVAFACPVCEYYPAPYQNLSVFSNQNTQQQTISLVDFDAIFSQEYHQRFAMMITKIVLSTLVKEATSFVAVRSIENDSLRNLAWLILYSTKTILNVADTRNWDTLPKEIQFLQIPFPEDYKLSFSFEGQNLTNQQITFSSDCQSAIIFVHSPAKNIIRYHVFEMKSK